MEKNRIFYEVQNEWNQRKVLKVYFDGSTSEATTKNKEKT